MQGFHLPEPRSVGSEFHGESSLSFTNEKGATLILPYEVSREDTLHDKLFREHMLKYHQQWYNFAIDELHRDIKLHELILVTGCDPIRQWEWCCTISGNGLAQSHHVTQPLTSQLLIQQKSSSS